MFGLQRICQVMATGALGGVLLGAQAGAPNCPSPSAEALLDANPAAGASGFALTEKLCGATLVRSRSAPMEMPAEPELLPVDVQPAAPVVTTSPPVSVQPLSTRDPAGQARIRSLAPLMAQVAQRHDIDPLLLHALAHIESRHQSQAISPAGARGLMQLMPATGRGLGVANAERELLSPEANLDASARYLKQLQARFGNDLRLVLAAYNAGEGAVERHGRRVPPFAETQAYVRDVMAVYAELRRRFGAHA
ncbi:lytic transglycosylase domain-containing protein [Roseateles sp. NT4]|uniref:lytic transglycosylase domain-containing protein n=1 Tax=Roseateles sp. NT4 TaxID=3453715 RepID=UPI003EEAE3D0